MASRSIAHSFIVGLISVVVVPSLCVRLTPTDVFVPSRVAVTNPTGTCEPKENANDNGARPRYHSPAANATYLPDCNLPLKREYWRVFAVSESSAYVIPHMDTFGVASKHGVCTDEVVKRMSRGDDELAYLLKKYNLCKEDLDSVDIQVLKNMKPAEALRITHALHKQLCFQAQAEPPGGLNPNGPHKSQDGLWTITPEALDDDINDVCSRLLKKDYPAAADYCDKIRKFFDCTGPCDEMTIHPSVEVVKVLVPGLNRLYGTGCAGVPGLM